MKTVKNNYLSLIFKTLNIVNVFKHGLIYAILILPILLFDCTLVNGQSIHLERVGPNRIEVYNLNQYSIKVEIDGANYVIPRFGKREAYFPLNIRHVVNSEFKVSYDMDCYNKDIEICNNDAMVEASKANLVKGIAQITSLFFKKRKNFDAWWALVSNFLGSLGLSKECIAAMKGEFYKLYQQSKDMEEFERNIIPMLEDAEWAYRACLFAIISNNENCKTDVLRRYNSNIRDEYYQPTKMLKWNEKFRWEMAVYVPTLFGVRSFRGFAQPKGTVKRENFKMSPSLGGRMSFNFNAYKSNGERRWGVNYYIPIDVFNTRAVYSTDSAKGFDKNTSYSWLMTSVGFGIESNWGKNAFTKGSVYGFALFADAGIVSNSMFVRGTDENHRVTSQMLKSSFQGVAAYINLGAKIRVTRWMDVYASYYSTLLYKNAKKDLPSFGQLNLGVNFSLMKFLSYQY